MERMSSPPPKRHTSLLDATPRNPNNPYTKKELKELAIAMAETDLSPSAFAKLHEIPEWRTHRAQLAFAGLIKKIRDQRKRKK